MTMNALRIAVIGGGIFGVTSAIELSRRGHRVDLYERDGDLLRSASGINQYRLHRGYHYPRSRETAIDCRDSEIVFQSVFSPAVVTDVDHYYAVAARDSLTSADDYVAFCRTLGLEFEIAEPDVLIPRSMAITLRVREHLFEPTILRAIAWDRLRASGVAVHLEADVQVADLDDADVIVVATYAELNRQLRDHAGAQRPYQFEVCEKPVVRLPEVYARQSVVVMDGPFMCFDPMGSSDLHVLGHVVHAIHATNVGLEPQVPAELVPLLNKGVVERPAVTNFDRFVEAGREFFPRFDETVHVGSMYTVRAVLPGVEGTDSRPTLVRQVDDRIITVFSGKIATCVGAALQVASLVDDRLSASA